LGEDTTLAPMSPVHVHSRLSSASIPPAPGPDAPSLPDGLRGVFERVAGTGRRTWLVGEGLHTLLIGERARCFEALAEATPEEILALFPRAIATRPDAGIVTVPSASGPIDFRCTGGEKPLVEELERRGLSVLALAFDPISGESAGPASGLEDVAKRRLRAVGDPRSWISGVGLRAARLISEAAYEMLPDTLDRMQQQGAQALPGATATLRGELRRILLGPGVRPALEYLRASGIEAHLVSDVREDAARVVASLPAELPIRLVAWLRDAGARNFLRRVGFGVQFSQEIYRLLDLHPIDRRFSPNRQVALSRLLKRLSPGDLALLFELREAEIAALEKSQEASLIAIRIEEERASVTRMQEALERARGRSTRAGDHPSLALSGREVMKALGCGPGPEIGRALSHLAGIVALDPTANDRDTLLAELEAWKENACRPS